MSRNPGNQEKTRPTSAFLSRKIKNREVEFIAVSADGEAIKVSEENFKETFDDIEPIAQGTQGKIYAVQISFRNEDGQTIVRECVAKKIISKKKLCAVSGPSLDNLDLLPEVSEQSHFNVHNEVTKDMETSSEHNILKLLAVIDGFAILPFADLFLDDFFDEKQSLVDLMHKNSEAYLRVIVDIFDNVLEAMIYSYFDKHVIHGDGKPANIVLYRGC